jgi:cation diffusion facilitator CzcD-associated flavoprotein CzcO
MAFRSYPFDSSGGGEDDWPRFPSHQRVLEYLQRFAADREVVRLVEFDHEVTDLAKVDVGWAVETHHGNVRSTRQFDAVAVCNGHFSVPRIPEIAGAESFPGDRLHSHDYRRPEPFAGMRVAVVGTGSSGFDLAIEIASVADQVVWCGDVFAGIQAFPGVPNVSTAPTPERLTSTGELVTDGQQLPIDVVLWCTGYHYDLSFIEDGIVSGGDAPEPLYQHLMPIGHPTMALIGTPQRIIPFPLFEMQAKWFARLLAGHVSVPDEAEMRRWLETWQQRCRDEGRQPHRFRNLGNDQFDYIDELAAGCGADPLPDWYRPLARETQELRAAHPVDYRDRPLVKSRYPCSGLAPVPVFHSRKGFRRR